MFKYTMNLSLSVSEFHTKAKLMVKLFLDEKLTVLDLTKYQKKNMHGWIDAQLRMSQYIHNIYHRAVDQDRNQTQL